MEKSKLIQMFLRKTWINRYSIKILVLRKIQ